MGVVVRLHSGRYCLFLEGASEILTKKCARHVVVSKNPDHSQHADSEIETKALDEITRDNISRTIIFYVNQMLSTIALCYWDFESLPPADTKFCSANEVSYEDLSCDMTLVAITGIEDPLRVGVCEAIATCRHAGVTVDPQELTEVDPRLQVLAWSSPEDNMDDNFASIVKAITWGRCVDDGRSQVPPVAGFDKHHCHHHYLRIRRLL